jgi:hypothetical protein
MFTAQFYNTYKLLFIDPIFITKNECMKKVYFLLAMLVISATIMAHGTPQDKQDLRNDLAKERVKRHDVAKDIFRGEPEKATADNRAAIAYHNAAHRDARHIEQIDRRRMHRHHPVVIHHRRHYPHHRRTVVVIRH